MYEGDGTSEVVPPRHKRFHYHGDEVRVLFVVAAVVLVVAESTNTPLPISPVLAVTLAMILIIAAGITNPAQRSIHWLNALLSAAGTLLFGTTAVGYYRGGASLLTRSFTFTEALALLSLVALYFTTRTIRGILQREDKN